MKRRKLWIAPAILMFGAVGSRGQETTTTDPDGAETDCARQGSSCGQSVVRYGADCGVRNYGHCRPRNHKDCSPVEMGSHCYPGRNGNHCSSRTGEDCYPCRANSQCNTQPPSYD